MNQGWIYCDRITAADAGQRVLEFYTNRYPHSTAADWLGRLQAGQIRLEGQIANGQDILGRGQQLAYHRPPWEEPPVPLGYTVLHEDDQVLVIDKPAGLPVLPGGNFLHHTLLHQLQQAYPDSPPLPVHRLGRGTSGLMVLARSRSARAHLSRQFRHATDQGGAAGHRSGLQKTYRALIAPGDCPPHLMINTPIGKLPHPTLGYVYGACLEGRVAHSQVTLLNRGPRANLVEVVIRTGRPHQIRIHLAAAGYPLLGDPLYTSGGVPRLAPGAPVALPGDGGYFLHAYRLQFIHPSGQQPMVFTLPPPWPAHLYP
ncbi:MAG: RluA family pseudouridine synthase [Cyanobacteriota bacterium]|nr:RluA family pseudouridine synthase [Cyanobacteriota bacterium]